MTEFRCEVISSRIVTGNRIDMEIAEKYAGSFTDVAIQRGQNSLPLFMVNAIVSEDVMEAIDNDQSFVVIWSEAVVLQESMHHGFKAMAYQRAKEQPFAASSAPLKQPDSQLSVSESAELKSALLGKGIDWMALLEIFVPGITRRQVAEQLK